MRKRLGTCNRVRYAVDRIPSTLKDEFRQFYLKADIKQTRLAVVLLIIPSSSLAYNDYQFFGFSSLFYALLAIKFGMLFFSAWMFFFLPKTKNYCFYDKLIFFYLLTMLAATITLNAMRPQNAIAQLVVVSFGIFGIYLLFNTKFVYQVTLTFIITVGQVILLLLNMHLFPPETLFAVLISLLSANLIAAVGSWQLHTYRWRLFRDLNERKITERLATIGQVAGMVGHDLRNPLQTITGEVYLARKELTTLPPCKQKINLQESIDAIAEQTLYMDKIVSDLQTFVKPVEVHRQTVNLSKLITALLPQIGIPHNINIHIQVGNTLTVTTDPLLLKRVLVNLITNAVQAMPNGGQLIVKAETNTEEQIQITVKDTGVGIPDNVIPKLFTPLFTTKAKGQGFGLAVCKHVLEAQGGTITFESQQGKGAAFIVSLPLKNKPPKNSN